MNRDAARAGRRRLASEATGLGIGAIVSGIAVYAYAAIGNRALGATAFAPVSVLWTYWTVTGAAVSFPVQHWVIRRARADAGEAGVRHALPRMTALIGALAAASGIGAWLLRSDLFHRTDLVFPVFTALIPAGAGAMGLMRGTLAARGRFGATALAFAGENLIRVALAVPAAALGWSAGTFGGILIAGFAIATLWPGALIPRRDGAHDGRRQLGFLAGVAAGSLIAQLVLTGGPVALALAGGAPAAVTSVFAALALFRAPYVLATGVSTRITGTLTGFVVEGETSGLRRFMLAVVGGTALAAAAAAGLAASIGPPLLRALFGGDIDLPRDALALIGAGSGLALGTLAQGLVLISRARSRAMIATWTAALALGIAWTTAGPGGPIERVAWAFVLAEAVAFAAMLVLEARALKRSGPAPGPNEIGEILLPGS